MEEMANIQKLARQAFKTFKTPGGSATKQNIELLKSMMGSITAEDVNLGDPSRDRRRSLPNYPPVTHVNIIECQYFSMAIFIVNKNQKLPLHDHPGMYGLCKVLYGSIQVGMYDRLESDGLKIANGTLPVASENGTSEPQKFILRGTPIITADSDPCMVTPSYGNYHTIKAVNGAAAFLDILGPPYDMDKGRDCQYYKECPSGKIPWENEDSNVRYLIQVPCPPEFFCDSQDYQGPKVVLEDLVKSCEIDRE